MSIQATQPLKGQLCNTPLQSFLLPSIHSEIPTQAILKEAERGSTAFCKALLEAGVLNLRDIPESAESVHEIIQAGLAAWFNRRLPNLRVIRISMHLLDEAASIQFLEEFAEEREPNTSKQPWFSLQVVGCSNSLLELKTRAVALEKSLDGLFKTAFDAVTRASYITTYILQPQELLYHFSGNWDWDCAPMPKDKDVRESMLDRFGDSNEADNYLPSAISPLLGGDHCLSECRPKKKRFLSKARLSRFANESKNSRAVAVASQTIVLLTALKRAKAVNAKFPSLENLFARPVTSACNLIYLFDDRVGAALDEIVDHAYNCGEGTECIGHQDLPTTAEGLRKYFSDLDLACSVLREMDKLISMISTPFN